jgi:hypothetical protein
MNTTSMPVILIWVALTKAFLAYSLWWLLMGWETALPWFLPARLWPVVRDLNVLLTLPNTVRQACLMLMSNTSHYYGDIPPNDVFYQNQIVDHPIVWPFQLFCFNFGATHILHHYGTHTHALLCLSRER